MDLFIVNRYEGEKLDQSENSNNHLSDLLKRIEERKRQKLEAASAAKPKNESTEIQKPENASNKRKKTKKKLQNQSEIKDEMKDNSKNDELANESENLEMIKNQDFMILGSGMKKGKKKVTRVLPRWLAHPEIISADLKSGPNVEDVGEELDKKFIEILKANKIDKLFPVQSNIIKWLFKCNKDREMGWWPRDTCVSAPTGSGKTLAYVLPVIQHLQSRFVPKIRCLIVLPVQELAAQVYKVFLTFSAHTNLKVGLISGATSFEVEQSNLVKKTQRGQFFSRVDIIIATPGRLVDHIEKTEGFCLEALRFLVIDEADRATDWLQYLPPPHSRAPPLTLGNTFTSVPPAQKLLFSATLSQDPEKLNRLCLFQPILFTSVSISDRDDDVDLDREPGDFMGRYTSPNELEERAVQCNAEYKPLALKQLLTANETIEKALIFTNSGKTAHRLTILLRSLLSERNVIVDELSAMNLAPKHRIEVLNRFATGNIHVLVSSDALARGLDIPGVKLVIAYDLPKHIEGYIHRAGRTGRAGTSGTAISLLTPNQISAFTRMLTSAHKIVPTIENLDDLEVVGEKINYPEHIDKLKEILEKEQAEILEKAKGKRRH